jgi:hypothetical protein
MKDEVLVERVLVVERKQRQITLKEIAQMMHGARIGQEFRMAIDAWLGVFGLAVVGQLFEGVIFVGTYAGVARNGLRGKERIEILPTLSEERGDEQQVDQTAHDKYADVILRVLK